MTSAPDQDRAPIELPHRARLEILGAVLLGIFLAALDQTIVGTALPVIVTELNGNDVYVWAFTAYLVTATISGPVRLLIWSATARASSQECTALTGQRSRRWA